MRKSPAGVSWLAGVLALGWLACLLFGPAAIARTSVPQAQSFDIPELPLKDALARFDALTRMSVFYPSSLVEGRRSHAVSGIHSPHEALEEMLSGTGVTAELTAENAFVLAPVNSPVSQESPRDEANAAASYHGTLQNAVLRALCASPSLSLGDYRLAMTVQVGANARVSRVRLLDTTGDSRRDTAIVQRLQGLDVGRVPADTTRPFVMLLLPTGCRESRVACVQSPCRAMTEH
ncbi:Ferripyoverdine receptor [Pandoraea aquatica]|uniref:Ferripyoverdine receptor n=1 Tax=Pandoraea aquatica TaxID=2508290 RepID=A0A5E4UPI0_9BURK|nr:STN domain-containing protein [Pandoraea aquatica]VVE01846.1 Ferripyoverdine receptor [Pandoraea aquatica]